MLVFRILLLAVLAVSAIGSVGGNREDQRTMMKLFGLAGALFLLSLADVESRHWLPPGV